MAGLAAKSIPYAVELQGLDGLSLPLTLFEPLSNEISMWRQYTLTMTAHFPRLNGLGIPMAPRPFHYRRNGNAKPSVHVAATITVKDGATTCARSSFDNGPALFAGLRLSSQCH